MCVCVWCVSGSVDVCKFCSVSLCLSVWIFFHLGSSIGMVVCACLYACTNVHVCESGFVFLCLSVCGF